MLTKLIWILMINLDFDNNKYLYDGNDITNLYGKENFTNFL